MADVARRLISKIVSEGDFYPALNGQIRDTWFEDAEHRRVFQWMLDYYTRYKETPTPRALKLEFPPISCSRRTEPYL